MIVFFVFGSCEFVDRLSWPGEHDPRTTRTMKINCVEAIRRDDNEVSTTSR